jgi:hypothetical protein
VGQLAAKGALPSVLAATSPEAEGGHYYDPNSFRELKGTPADANFPHRATDTKIAVQQWALGAQTQTGGNP